ncbi:hypothetical protein BGW39_006835 [Mortierella sp. 14UC]|nr:hypothetical protein BGW39_006835 [Mortierella sp. 14UC]
MPLQKQEGLALSTKGVSEARDLVNKYHSNTNHNNGISNASQSYEAVKQAAKERQHFLDEGTGQVFKNQGTLGEGGYKLVYKISDTEGANYVLKTYRGDIVPESVGQDAEAREKYAGEKGKVVYDDNWIIRPARD